VLIGGIGLMLASIGAFAVIGWNWMQSGFTAPPSVLPITLAAAIGVMGLQSMLGGFLIAIISGHEAQFVPSPTDAAMVRASKMEAAA